LPFNTLEGQVTPQNSFVSIQLADSYPIASISYFPALQVFMENARGQ
jgi:hypothetical protein